MSKKDKEVEKENLSTKNIKDFTTDDTIYIRDYAAFNKQAYLCQFVSYDEKKKRVTGTIIAKNQDYENHTLGKKITAALKDCYLHGYSGDEVGGNKHYHAHWFNSLGYALDPIDAEKESRELHVPNHESYGMIGGSRRSSRGVALFGSSIQHNQTITITISTATHTRGYNNDHIFADKQLIEVEVSENQFAQFVTSMNIGSGVPCTIRHAGGKRMADPPYMTKQEIFEGEFQNTMDNFAVDLKRTFSNVSEILAKPSIGKGDKELIKKSVDSLIATINSNLSFMRRQFREQMENVVQDAKSQIEAFAEHVIRTKGLEALAASNPDLKDILLELKGKKEE